MTDRSLTQSEIKALVDYDSETGFFSKKGWAIGSYLEGYLKLRLKGKMYQAHRIAWTMYTGSGLQMS